MSGALDSIFAGSGGLVKNLLNTYGTTALVEYNTDATYDPTTMTDGAPVATSYTVTCSPPSPWEQMENDDNTVVQGDIKLIIPESDTTEIPPVGCKVTLQSLEWRAVRVDPIMSGDEIAAYRLQLRRT